MEVGKTFVSIGANTAPLAAGLAQAKGMTAKATASMTAKLAGIGKGMTIAGAIIVASFGMAIKTAKKFEQSMANTASVAGATAEELKKLSNYARKMGEQSVFSASQAADGMYFLASAGMDTNEIMGALEGTLALAAATASDLAYTSESVAATLSQFGFAAEEAGRVSNVFAAAISGSQATMEKLTNSMSYVGPMAKSMGMTLENTTGILMNLYNAGLQGSKAGTALRMAFVKLIDPTTKGTDALERLRVVIKDSSGELRPFEEIINELGEAGMTTADAMDIFGIRAGPAMMALVSQGTGAIKEMTDKITGTNKATEMAAMQINTFEGAMKLLKSAFEEAQITLVQELMPSLKELIEWITKGVKKVTAWMKANPKLTESIVKWTAAIGALMLVLGPLLMILPGLVTAITGIKIAILAIGTVSTGPIGLFILAVGAIVLGFKKWQEHSEKTRGENAKLKASLLSIAEVADRIKVVTKEIKNLEKQVEITGGSIFLAGDLTKKRIEDLVAELEALKNEMGEGIETVDAFAQSFADKMLKIKMAIKEADWGTFNIGMTKLNELAKEGKISASELYKAMQKLAIETGVVKDKTSELAFEEGKIVTTIEGLKSEMEMLTKEHESYGESVCANVQHYTIMIEKLNEIGVILETELSLLEQGTEKYRGKQKEIYENIKAINTIKETLGELIEPLKGLDLIAVKMALLGDSIEEIPAKLELLREKSVLLKQALGEAIPKTKAWGEAKIVYEANQKAIEALIGSFEEYGEKGKELLESLVQLTDKQRKLQEAIDVVGVDKQNVAYQKLKIEYNSNEAAIASLITQMNNLESEQKEAEQSAKDLANAYKTITDKIYELTHTPMENAIYKLDQQKQEYLKIGVAIKDVNKWYDLQIEKLHELNPELDDTTKKLKEAGEATKQLGILGGESFSGVTAQIKHATVALSNFTKEGVAAAIASIKMKFYPIIVGLISNINTSTGIFKQIAEANLARIKKTMYEQIDVIKYGLNVYNNAMAQMSGGGSGGGWGTPSYQQGTPYVPQTGMALLHQGEAIIPANQNTYNTFSPTVTVNAQSGNAQNIAYEVKKVLGDMSVDFRRG